MNPQPETGISSSVQLAIDAITDSQAKRAVILLADQPRLSAAQLGVILRTEGEIVVPRYAGKPGNPVVLDRSVWPLVSTLTGDRGMSQLFNDHAGRVVYVDVPGANPDVDTREDLARLG